MEDCLYMYPKDEIISSNAETVRKIKVICEELGRPVATQAQTGQILGLDEKTVHKQKGASGAR